MSEQKIIDMLVKEGGRYWERNGYRYVFFTPRQVIMKSNCPLSLVRQEIAYDGLKKSKFLAYCIAAKRFSEFKMDYESSRLCWECFCRAMEEKIEAIERLENLIGG